MKKAFTLYEMIIVIVVVSILAILAMPRLERDELEKAADQVISHIRYTQHLAMINDKFVPHPDLAYHDTSTQQKTNASKQWFKQWWQIQFHTAESQYAYTIYSDHPADGTSDEYSNDPDFSTNPKLSDMIAKDPHTGLYIAKGGSTHNDVPEDQRLQDVDLFRKYGVTVSLNNCEYPGGTSTADHILFDEVGRPHCSKSTGNASVNPYDRIQTNRREITLSDGSSSIKICVEPETGYAHICS